MRRISVALAALLIAVPTVRATPVDDALEALYQRGVTLKSLAADVTLKTVDTGTGDDKTKSGRFVLQKLPGGDTRVRATFDKTVSGNVIDRDKRDYLLTGTDLIERDYAAKKQTTRQARQPGDKTDLFKLDGPFPLPMGQKPDDVRRDFDIEDLKTTDTSAIAEVKLSPKPKTPMAAKFKSITVKVDRDKRLPTVISTVDPEELVQNTVTLSNLRADDAVTDKDFELDKIDPTQWDLGVK